MEDNKTINNETIVRRNAMNRTTSSKLNNGGNDMYGQKNTRRNVRIPSALNEYIPLIKDMKSFGFDTSLGFQSLITLVRVLEKMGGLRAWDKLSPKDRFNIVKSIVKKNHGIEINPFPDMLDEQNWRDWVSYHYSNAEEVIGKVEREGETPEIICNAINRAAYRYTAFEELPTPDELIRLVELAKASYEYDWEYWLKYVFPEHDHDKMVSALEEYDSTVIMKFLNKEKERVPEDRDFKYFAESVERIQEMVDKGQITL